MDKLTERLNSLAIKSPIELVYLQTNKDIYETGEDLWFKAYLLDRHSFTPVGLSKTLYIQLINETSKQAVLSEKYEIQKGFSDGHLSLPEKLADGDYLLAAYTGNTFFNDSTSFNALCKIKIKKDMKPRISVDQTFNRLFYRPNDSIRLILSMLTEYGEILPKAEIQTELRRGDKKLGLAKVSGNLKGEATVVFAPQKSGEGLRIDMKIRYLLKEESLTIPVPCKKGSPIQFEILPEGGNLVSELASRLAFKAVNSNGEPLDVEGTVFEDDKPLWEFKSAYAGMGSVMITPNADKKYSIRLSKPQTDSIFLLPKVFREGIVMQAGKRNDKFLEINVFQSSGRAKRTVYLRGQLRGGVYCMASGELNNQLKFKVPLDEFPFQGIAEFTLFDENLTPVAERLVYVNPDKKLNIETKLSKEKYETREKASLKITVTDEKGEPVVANLGVSVFDKIYYNAENPKNILTYFFLSSQLKGNIFDPAYYFDAKNKDRNEVLDLLLLTQGWRRYVWNEENLKGTVVSKQLITDDNEGRVYITKKKKEAPKELKYIKAYNPEKMETQELLVTDTAGIFKVTPRQFKKGQGGYVYLNPITSPDFGPMISISDPFKTINETRIKKEIEYPLSKQPPVKKKEDFMTPFVGNHSAIKLPEFVVQGSGNKVFREKYLGYLDSISRLKTPDYVCVMNIFDCPNHRTDFRNRKPVEGEKYRNPNGGFIIYHHSTPIFSEDELMKMFNLTKLKGYYPHREFYQPNYDKVSDENLIADFRNTLLWAPTVMTNEKGEATLEFFCSDVNFNFVGRVEGVSGAGLLGTKEFGFTVKRPTK